MEISKVDFLVAAEFEVRKGTEIISFFPKNLDLSLESMLIEKMIPYGSHNSETEFFQFKCLIPLAASAVTDWAARISSRRSEVYLSSQKKKIKGTLSISENLVIQIEASESQSMEIDMEKVLFTAVVRTDTLVLALPTDENGGKEEELIFLRLDSPEYFSDLQIFSNLMADKSSKKMIESIRKKTSLHERVYINSHVVTLMKCIRTKSVERGATFKSVSLISMNFRGVESFSQILELAFSGFESLDRPTGDSCTQDSLQEYRDKVGELLQHFHSNQHQILILKPIELCDSRVLKPIHTDKEAKTSNIKQMIEFFGMRIMHIYRELLQGGKVVVVGKSGLSFLNLSVRTMALLVSPINIEKRVYPYETLGSLKLLALEQNFIVGFNIPIVKNEKDFYSLYIDLDEKRLFNKEGEELKVNSISGSDRKFASLFINSKNMSEKKILSSFFKYTDYQIHVNSLDPPYRDEYEKELQKTIAKIHTTSIPKRIYLVSRFIKSSFENVFGGDHAEVFQAYQILFRNTDFDRTYLHNDLMVFQSLDILERKLDSEAKICFFLEVIREYEGTLDRLFNMVYLENKINLEIWRKIMKKAFEIDWFKQEVESNGLVFKILDHMILIKKDSETCRPDVVD